MPVFILLVSAAQVVLHYVWVDVTKWAAAILPQDLEGTEAEENDFGENTEFFRQLTTRAHRVPSRRPRDQVCIIARSFVNGGVGYPLSSN
jgi:hypothetical protein